MTSTTRSRTARIFGALVGAVALCAALPAPAFADRDGRGGRDERHDGRGHGHHDGRRHDGYRHGHSYAVHRHGAWCSHRPVYGYAHRQHHPHRAFFHYGWFFGR
jgi:hypothetical protein